MSHQNILGQIFLATSVAFATSVQASENYIAPSAYELGQRATISANIAPLKACFQEFSVEEKPLGQMKATDAKQVLDCVDQKTVDLFLKDPTQPRDAISNLMFVKHGYSEAGNQMQMDTSFAREVAELCGSQGKTLPRDFAKCANQFYNRNEILGFVKFFGGVMAVAGVGVAACFVSRRRKESQSTLSHDMT